MHDEFAIIVAGGKGLRFGSALPKQFLALKGIPVLFHTLEAFYRYAENIRIILVLPADQVPTWHELVKKHDYRKPVVVQEGGPTRFQSVRRGLELATGEGYVAIHDGVRPLVSPGIIAESFRLARKHGAAVATVPLKESLRHTQSPSSTKAVDRNDYRIVQTPQTFKLSLIHKAYEIAEADDLTDDASVAERAGFPVVLFEGSYRNIKITSPEDLSIAEALMHLR